MYSTFYELEVEVELEVAGFALFIHTCYAHSGRPSYKSRDK